MELVPKVSQINPVHKPFSLFNNNNSNNNNIIIIIAILPSKPESSKWFLPFGFTTETLYPFSFFRKRATCPAL